MEESPSDPRQRAARSLAARRARRAERSARRAAYAAEHAARVAGRATRPIEHEVGQLGRRKKIAILGGGMAGIATALQLTHPKNPCKDYYDVTVYQQGWRLGGKCASGRNRRKHMRIEEHGLHILFGFYENTFRMIRETMAEWDLPNEHPWEAEQPDDRWRRAFTPTYDTSVVEPRSDKTWDRWDLRFPSLSGTPGDGGPARDDLLDFLDAALDWADTVIAMRDEDPQNPDRCYRDWLGSPEHPRRKIQRAKRRHQHRQVGVTSAVPIALKLGALILKAGAMVSPFGRRRRLSSLDENSKVRVAVDLLGALIWGLIWNSPRIYFNNLDALDRYELRDFLRRYGARAKSVESPLIDALYDSMFATLGGTSLRAHENLAAGVALRMFLNITLGYKGAPLWKMNAGMGDTIFTPAYEVLKKRGVKFLFFHRVVGLELQGNRVHRIRISRQADIVESGTNEVAPDAAYRPLVCVEYRDGAGTVFREPLRCWPSTPDFSQLENGEELEKNRIDFEQAGNTDSVERFELCDGTHFDHVVLAIPSSAFASVCPDLVAANPAIARMVREVRHVGTQAYQVWLKASPDNVGWQSLSPVLDRFPLPVLGNFVDPLNTWSDMTQVLPAEQVPDAQSVAYFCGAMPDSASKEELKEAAGKLLDAMAASFWTKTQTGYRAFDRRLIASEYFRANTNPTDRYVLSVAGTTQHRLRVDQTGCENLTFAGDWTRNGLNVGAVEAAVTSAMQASHHISGYPRRADIVRDSGL
jgi:uncharacterized protein with NAD-binding domain and iron-sulfur cluster